MKIVKGITFRRRPKFLFTSNVCMYQVIMLENRVFKGCKGIIYVLYLQTIELIDNRKLKQIDPKLFIVVYPIILILVFLSGHKDYVLIRLNT